ncbi:MAG: hypothetical protein WBZ42_03635 [Halobacteriota archaeon]
MNEGIETEVEVEQSFRFSGSHLQQAEQYLADPRKHAEHHMMFLDESDENLGEFCDLKDEVDRLRKEVDELNDTVFRLCAIFNWDNVMKGI